MAEYTIGTWLKGSVTRLAQHQMYLNLMYSRQGRRDRGPLQHHLHSDIDGMGLWVTMSDGFSSQFREDLQMPKCMI